MRISANDIKSGNILDYEGELWVVSKTPEHTKPGKGGAYVQVEMKNLRTGNKLNQRFSSSESVEKAFLERKEMHISTKKKIFWCLWIQIPLNK
jgi:elongation factor P